MLIDETGDTNDDTMTEPSLEAVEAESQEAMLAAARAAAKAEASEESSEDGEGEESPEKGPPEKPKAEGTKAEEDEDASVIAKALREREKVQGKLAEVAQREADASRRYQEAESAVERAKTFLAEAEREAQRIQKLRSNPVQALQELGWSAEDIIDHANNQKNPEWQERRKQEQWQAQIEAQWKAQQEELQSLREIAQSYETERTRVQAEAAEKALLTSFPADSPITKLYSADYILNWAYQVRDQYVAKTRTQPSINDLCDYLHAETLKRVKELGFSPQQEAAGSKTASKSKANGSRGLSQRDASTRLAPPAPKSIDDMDSDEEREYLISIAQEAKAQYSRE